MALRAGARRLLSGRYVQNPISRRCSTTPEATVTAEQLLADTDLQSLLQRHKKSASDAVLDDAALRMSLLSHFALRTGRPVASDALAGLRCAEDMAVWYARVLRQSAARPHARGLIAGTLGDGENPEELEERIDLQREQVQEELIRALPQNLQLDPATFRKPAKLKIEAKAKHSLPVRKRW